MEPLISFALSVFTLFGFYALLAWGLGLIFGQLNVVNVAHGDLVMVGAFVMVALPGAPFAVRVLLAVVVGVVLGIITERLLLASLYERGMLATLLAMWGVGIVLRQAAEAIFGSTPRSVPAPVSGSVTILGVQYPTYRLVAASVALAVVAAGILVIFRTDVGLRLRASMDNREMASLLGISPALMITGTFALGAALAVLAGALQSPMLGITPSVGVGFLAPAFFAVLIGRPGSLTGPVLGAFVVAVLETALRTWFSETVAQLVFFAALIAVIAVRPQGLNWRLPSWIHSPRAVEASA